MEIEKNVVGVMRQARALSEEHSVKYYLSSMVQYFKVITKLYSFIFKIAGDPGNRRDLRYREL